jgi:hypothetical protein
MTVYVRRVGIYQRSTVIRKEKNGQMQNDKGTKNDLHNILHRKQKIEQHEPH